jgi:hypothetical protein
MKLLFVLSPFLPLSSETHVSVAFLNLMDAFLLQCVEILPRLLSAGVPMYEYYQPEYDSEEETIDIGQERYEALLRTSHSKVSATSRLDVCLFLPSSNILHYLFAQQTLVLS